MKAKFLLPLLFLSAAANAGPGGAATLLPADRAFAFRAVAAGDGMIRAHWDVADGYYLYRDQTSFAITGQGRLAAPPALPPGQPHRDALLGDVAVYFAPLAVHLAVAPDGPGGYTLVATSQGCNLPIGVCYPPMTHRVHFSASATAGLLADASPAAYAAASATAIEAPDTLERLRALIGEGFAQPRFLPVDQAFQLEVAGVAPDRLEAAFTVAEGYYLYRDKIKFSGEHGVRVTGVMLPPGEIKDDPYFGEMAVFKGDFQAPVTVQRAVPDDAEITVHATYQGCAEDGICYAPVSKTFAVRMPRLIPGAFAGEIDPAAPPGAAAFAGERLITAGLPGILAGAFLAGLLLTFTPCVLPMLPILSAVIAGRGGGVTKRKGAALALVYVLGTATTYAAVGALAGATGEQLQAYFQNIWAIGILAAVLVAMALSLFGVFTIQMPSAVQTKWQQATRRLGGSAPVVFVLGAGSALVIGACVSPVLISFLSLAVSTGDPWLGAGMMVALALGMGVPLMALGLGAGHWIPRAGKWMKTVNHVFGVLLIGVAIYLLGALPEVPVLLLWGAFLVILSVYLGAIRALPAGAGGWRYFLKGAGLVLLVWGIAALIGGFFGERNLLRPLPAGLFSDAGEPRSQPAEEVRLEPLFTRVGTLDELDQALARAAGEDKPVMVEYYADWCTDCVRMERTTFRDARVRETLERNFIALKVDVTDPRDAHTRALKKRFGIFGPPAVLFFDRNGAELKGRHFYGYRGADDFYALIRAL